MNKDCFPLYRPGGMGNVIFLAYTFLIETIILGTRFHVKQFISILIQTIEINGITLHLFRI